MVKVDVFIPTWNSEKTLLKTLESLETGGVPIRRLVMTDVYSKDRTRAIAKSWAHARGLEALIVGNPIGLGASRYLAETELVESEIYVSLDSDVILSPGWFDKLYAKILTDPKIVFVSSYVLFGDPGTYTFKICNYQMRKRYFAPCMGSTLIRRGVADFSCMKDQKISEDTAFNRYLLKTDLKCFVDYETVSYHPRGHSGDLSHLVTWGRGAREMGRHPFVELGRIGRSLLDAPRVAWGARDPGLLVYYPLRELAHFYGYLTGSTRPDVKRLSFREELEIIRLNRARKEYDVRYAVKV